MTPDGTKLGYFFLGVLSTLVAVVVTTAVVRKTTPAPQPAAQQVMPVSVPQPAPQQMPLNASHQERLEIQSGMRRR